MSTRPPALAPNTREENRADTQTGQTTEGPSLEIRAWKPRSKGDFKEPLSRRPAELTHPRALRTEVLINHSLQQPCQAWGTAGPGAGLPLPSQSPRYADERPWRGAGGTGNPGVQGLWLQTS